ncbi:MAG TPA: DUF3379 family protein [Steroidobacteraceae bacterium]|nr:DUF3379 family protein [Steroidobacteraceae bacterium]
MQHAEFRRLFGANPKRTEPAVLEHRASCPECAKYADDMQRIDSLVRGALDVPAPSNYRKPWELAQQRRSPVRWYALAASVLVAMAIAGGAWLHVRRDVLFTELVKHAHGERNVMVTTDRRSSEDKVRTTLAKAGARLSSAIPVSTVRTCKVRGVVAPHLFVQTPDGPAQLLLLTEHRFLLSHATDKQGYHAELVPVGNHSVAVIAASEAAVQHGVRMVRQSIDWSP